MQKEISFINGMIAFKQTSTASRMHLIDGICRSLESRAFLTAVRPKLLSVLENIDTTSHETNRVPFREKDPFH